MKGTNQIVLTLYFGRNAYWYNYSTDIVKPETSIIYLSLVKLNVGTYVMLSMTPIQNYGLHE